LTPTLVVKLNVFGSLASIKEVSMGLSKLNCHFIGKIYYQMKLAILLIGG
jgi:hypothetical protein